MSLHQFDVLWTETNIWLTETPLTGVCTPKADAVAITAAITRRARVEFIVIEFVMWIRWCGKCGVWCSFSKKTQESDGCWWVAKLEEIDVRQNEKGEKGEEGKGIPYLDRWIVSSYIKINWEKDIWYLLICVLLSCIWCFWYVFRYYGINIL